MNGILAKDFNEDGNMDLLLVGNDYSPEKNVGRYDASVGNYLVGDGKGNFTPVSVNTTGFYVDGNAKSIVELRGKNDTPLLMISQQADLMKIFRLVTD